MTEQSDLKARLRRAAAICPWRAGQPAPMLNEAADRITDLEAERDEARAVAGYPAELAKAVPIAEDVLTGLREHWPSVVSTVMQAEARAQAAESRLALAEKVVEAGMDLQAATNTSRTWSVMEAQAWEALQIALTAYEENTSSKDLTTGEDDA